MATVYEQWLNIGLKSGLEGQELREFVTQQQRLDREERTLQREEQQKIREEQQKTRELEQVRIEAAKLEQEVRELARVSELEMREQDKRFERENAKLEQEVKELARVAELEMREQDKRFERENAKEQLQLERLRIDRQVQIERMRLEHEAAESEKSRIHEEKQGDLTRELNLSIAQATNQVEHDKATRHKCPRLPEFKESTDDIDAYLQRFEMYATAQKWREERWALNLSALLTGRALDVYSRLSIEEMADYKELKAALLQKYDMTRDGFRRKFRDTKPEKGETPKQCVARISRYFSRWVELSKTSESYKDLSELMIREQFVNICSKDLAEYLNRTPDLNLAEMVVTATQYLEAAGKTFDQSKTKSQVSDNKCSIPSQTKDKPNVYCKACKAVGHHTRDCSRGAPNAGGGRKCWICQSAKHLARECNVTPKGNAFVESPDVTPSDNDEVGSVCIGVDHKQVEGICDCCSGNEVELRCGKVIPVVMGACKKVNNLSLPVTSGYVGHHKITLMRDTGCTGVVVRANLVEADQMLGHVQSCMMIDGTMLKVPMAKIAIDTPYFAGEVEAMCMASPVYDLIVGNVPGAREPNNPNTDWRQPAVTAVMTRAQTIKAARPQMPMKIAEPKVEKLNVTVDTLVKLQQEDDTLGHIRNNTQKRKTKNTLFWYETKNKVLYKYTQYLNKADGCIEKQVVVPKRLRSHVMLLGHDSIFAGHLAVKKTLARICKCFTWPRIGEDVKRYCRSCDVCQRTVPKGKVAKIPLGQMPLIDVPFKRVAIDLIGPLTPMSSNGYRFILTIVDYATRYPEAVPLKGISTEAVAEALVSVFSRVGLPEELLSDMGSQFTSDLMKEVSRLLSIRQMTSSPYHPICNGLVEKMNGTLKLMLRRLAAEKPKEWDRYVVPLLFAYREVPNESSGFSPFELLYGRHVRGPLQILRECWTNEDVTSEVKSNYEYVLDLRERIEETCKLANTELAKTQTRYKRYYDRKARNRKYNIDDKVLILLPTSNNKLLLQWKGPFKVVDIMSPYDYRLDVNGDLKTFHANMLKQYMSRIDDDKPSTSVPQVAAIGVLDEQDEEDLSEILCFSSGDGENKVDELVINDKITESQRQHIDNLVKQHLPIFSDKPGNSDLISHEIHTTTDCPIRTKMYSLPYHIREVINKEVDEMLELGVIEKAESPYASPIVLVRKSDGSNRFCVDYRKINKITVFDPEPMTKTNDIFASLKGKRFFSKLDLAKGYWQIPMCPRDKEKTAFLVPDKGCYQFTKMPFGLVNSGATFNKLMREVLGGIPDVSTYVDDVLVHSTTWQEHVVTLAQVLTKLKQAGLTIKPKKCMIAFDRLPYIGHNIALDAITPAEHNIDKIRKTEPPKTKKLIRSFVGLAGYYRNHIGNFATLIAPLTDLTSKNKPNDVEWTPKLEQVFNEIKQRLCDAPLLQVPDFDKVFVVQVDACDTGIGAALMQEQNGELLPVAFASRKLFPRETKYSVIEKECLAVVYAVNRFHEFLYGKQFVLQTDHMPLVCLNKNRVANDRIMRWSLQLQPYNMHIEYIRGTDNVTADFLSRFVH